MGEPTNIDGSDLLASVNTTSGPIRLTPDGRMDAGSAAAYLLLSNKTLANYRSRGVGPLFIKRGRVFYRREDLDNWLAAGRCQSAAQARLKAKVEGQ